MDEISDKYSVDDILNEIEGKKSGGKPAQNAEYTDASDERIAFSGEDESLTAELAAIEKRRFGKENTLEVDSPSSSSADLTVTQILKDGVPRTKRSNTSDIPDFTVTQILNDGELNKQPFEPVKPSPIKRFNPVTDDTAQTQPQSKGESEQEYVEEYKSNRLPQTAEVVARERLKPDSSGEGETDAPKRADTKKILKTVVIDNVPIRKPHKPTYLQPEEKERLQKLREEELLEKEMALEDPDELIDSINPYDVKNVETPADSEVISVKLTRDMISSPADTLETSAPSDFAEFAETPQLPEDAQTSKASRVQPEEVKEYKPSFEMQPWQKKHKKKLNFKEDLDITPMLQSLNKSFAEKRKSDINLRRTLNADTLSSVGSKRSYKGKTIPAKLNIDYKKQIIEDSAVLPPSVLHSRQLEERLLGDKKKRKVRDFIFEDIDDDEYDELENEENVAEDEYDDYNSSDLIRMDLEESHKGLKWRFALLLLITAFSVFLTFVNDIGGADGNFIRSHIISKWFNGAYASYATAFVFTNLIAGVIGMVLCSGIIIRGLKNLFALKADCDSACALPCVMTTAASIAHIAENDNTALLQQGMAHIYVSVALCGLMFNTLGKIFMIVRAKKNFAFISGDSVKYSAYMPPVSEDSDLHGFTKGLLSDVPAPIFMRQTEFLTDYLKNSYCVDWADLICRKLVPIAAISSIVAGVLAFFLPIYDAQLTKSICWAVTAGGAFISALLPFSIMFVVNNPLLRASNVLAKSDCVVMGFNAAHKFSYANAVIIDARVLFPPGSVRFLNARRCQKPNAINSINIDESIVISASLAIKTDSIMSSMFNDMISGDKDLLYKIENCIYEVNMGIMGWMGTQRVLLGNREQMKHHGIEIPDEEKERKYRTDNADVVYLAVGTEAVAMFFIEVIPNPAVKNSLRELDENEFVLAVKTEDSLVTVAKLADMFELEPSRIRVLPFDLHKSFEDYSRYTSRGSSEIACNGTFTSFAKALVTAKTLIRDMMVTSALLFMTVIIAALMGLIFTIFAATGMLSASTVIIYNTICLFVVFILQGLRRY
ncbi:MAG: hypothetical protein FWF94_07465 [Oscillospiraceae bacterium]|nr:hypothetical protein [Oscillospiraceae bacterium]